MAVDESALALVRSHMHSVRIPAHQDKVYKEECMFSFDTPESPDGLFVSLTTFQGFGKAFVGLDYERTGNVLYLHEKWMPVPPAVENEAEIATPAPAGPQLGTGGEAGGLRLTVRAAARPPLDKKQSLVVMGPGGSLAVVPLPCPDLPERVLQAIEAVTAHQGVSVTEATAVWEEERRVSRYAADLPQFSAEGKKISPNPKDWRCEETGVTDNLWLNLSTGFIGSGRQNWDGTGGNGSALRHYEATGRKYPLVVKLGTITPHGADVYSYAADEDDMVTDPYLDKHLAHWGINMMQMQKTDKSMAELQLEYNTSYEFSRITEAGGVLKPVTGPGLTGLINLGNSCYMNSVLQLLWQVPSFRQRYVDASATIFKTAPGQPADDMAVQLAKVGVALVEGRTGFPAPTEAMEQDQPGTAPAVPAAVSGDDEVRSHAVRPLSFKSLSGRGHAEFSSGRQQDALEYFTHLMELVSRAEHTHAARLGVDPSSTTLSSAPARSAFTFKLEDRLQCMNTGAVRYSWHEEQWLGLNIPLEAATNKEAVEAYKEREAQRERLRAEDATAYIGAGGEESGSARGDSAGGQGAAGVVSVAEQEQPVVPQVPMAACLAAWAGDEVVTDVWSAAAGQRCAATKRNRFASLPPFLVVALKRYYTSENWVPKKMEVEVEVPERLDLEHLRAKGPQPGERLQPEDATATGTGSLPAPAAAPAPQADPELVSSLVSMGFSQPACTRAALAVNNAGAEAAMEWILGHLDDPDINDPIPAPDADMAAAAGTSDNIDAESVVTLSSMGFTETQATGALKACGGNVERAADWLFNHTDDLDAAVAAVLKPGETAAQAAGDASGGKPVLDGPGVYELVGIISHMGANTSCGHYVAHVKKGGRWYIFNDEKVAESEHPPRDLGYMYLFQRAA